MHRLLIIGAGDFGREVLDWALDIPADLRDWEVSGFLDSNPRALDGYSCGYRIIGDPLDHNPSADERFICAVGDPGMKLRLCRGISARGGRFITLIHPTATIGSRNVIGDGCLVCPNAVITTDAALGRHVTLNLSSTVGHNAVLGDGCTLSPHCDVTGHAVLGEGVFLGSHASVLPGIHVGDYAVIGAGSAVLRNVKSRSTVIGVPAKQVAGFKNDDDGEKESSHTECKR